jgi:hypothetical protein
MILTISVPDLHVSDANHYAMVLGYRAADALTYGHRLWLDSVGNGYAAASLPISDTFIGTATSLLARPTWDAAQIIDMSAARRAQALVVLWIAGGASTAPQASPDAITAIGGMNAADALALMGLTSVIETI